MSHDCLVFAASHGNLLRVENLLKKKRKGDLNAALIGATDDGYIDIVKLLIKHGATNIRGAFLTAIRENQYNIVEFLFIEYKDKCDINRGIEIAIEFNRTIVLDLLLNSI